MSTPHSAPNSRREVQSALREQDMTPTRGMGQNFMTDKSVSAWIVDQLDIQPEDTVMEIGPGLGALTQHLLGKGQQTFLLEKDARLAARLRSELGSRVTLIEGDAIRTDLRAFFKHQPLKVIGALPYSCGTEIIRNFLGSPSPVTKGVFVLQKEVVERFCASPSSPDRGLLSLRTQSRWVTKFLRTLPPEIFVPQPKVDSAVMSVEPRDRRELPVFDDIILDRLLRMGFSQRRKMLRKLLPDGPVPWEKMASELGISETARAQELTLRQWVDLSRAYDTHHLKDNPQKGDEVFDVVDEQDRVVGQRTRREVHAEGLLHRAVHLFVFNKRGELLLQKRSHLKDAMPEKWDSSAAGHLDSGEDYLPAAVRELEEEVGIKTTAGALKRLARIRPCAGTGMEWVELFATQHDGRIFFPCAEIECVQWFSIEELDAWASERPQDFAEGFLECFRAWRLCGGAAAFPLGRE